MVKRRDDKTPEPPGGRASERLRMFEQARRPTVSPPIKKPAARKTRGKGGGKGEDQKRGKD